MPTLPWPLLMSGLPVRKVQGNIYQVPVHILGPSEIGPYDELLKFVKTTTLYKMSVEVHHIVNGEHLTGTGWQYATAPCVVLSKGMHQQYHARFTETLPEYHSRLDLGQISQKDVLALYYDMFAEQTGWKELWTLSARILTGRTTLPNPRTFQTQ